MTEVPELLDGGPTLRHAGLWLRMGKWRKLVAESFAAEHGARRTLVIGCGDLTLKLPGEVVRLDISRDADGLNVHGNGECLPFRDGSFDFIVAMEVIEHVRKPHRFLSEISRVLATSAPLLLSTPNSAHLLSRMTMLVGAFIEDRTLHEDSVDHMHFFDYAFMRRILRQRFRHVTVFNRFITLPWFRYLDSNLLAELFPGLCIQSMFLCWGSLT